MAITLDELLGKNMTNTDVEQTVPQFPSYDEFKVSRNGVSQPAVSNDKNQMRYNAYESRNTVSSVNEDALRSYNVQSPFEKPKNAEFQSREYDFISTLQRPAFGENRDAFTRARNEREMNFSNSYSSQPVSGVDFATRDAKDLHEFTVNDKDRLSERELMAKLEHKAVGRIHMDSNSTNASVATMPENTLTHGAKKVKENKIAEYESDKKKAKLNTKSKVILAVYIAVILLVAVLIIVNAGDINRGTVVAPSSNTIQRTVENVSDSFNNASYNFSGNQIHFMYETAKQI